MYVVDATGKRHIAGPEFHALQVLGFGKVANQPGGYADISAADLANIPDSPRPAGAVTVDNAAVLGAITELAGQMNRLAAVVLKIETALKAA